MTADNGFINTGYYLGFSLQASIIQFLTNSTNFIMAQKSLNYVSNF